MTTQEQSIATDQGGDQSSRTTSWPLAALEMQALSELKAAIATCIAGAAARNIGREVLAGSYLAGAEEFKRLMDGGQPTLLQALTMAQACGYRLRISVEAFQDAVVKPEFIETPFEVTSRWMTGHVQFKDMDPDGREELLRQILAQYFGKLRDAGLYVASRG